MPTPMSGAIVRAPLDDDVAQAISELPEIDISPDIDFDAIRVDAATIAARFRGAVDSDLGTIPSRDDSVAGVRVRWYGPQPDADRDLIVFVHGGGWVAGDLDSYDDDVRLLARETGAAVVAVGYRRAPEHPFPAPLDDCVSVVRHVVDVPHRTLSLAGDSAGGNLVLGTAWSLRNDSVVDAVLALYPCVDPTAMANDSYRENGSGYLLTHDAMRTYWEVYATDERARRDPRVALLLGDLHGMPSTVVASAGYDPLRDENRELAARLVNADVDVTYLPHPTLTHGFQQMVRRVPAASRALAAVYAAFVATLRRAETRRTATASAPMRP